MEAIRSVETPVTTYKTAWCYKQEDHIGHVYYPENLKSKIFIILIPALFVNTESNFLKNLNGFAFHFSEP